jgi:NAD(P)-dependent dehydrogenase (short-subunit alcohol dehydrogenase family)
MNISGAVALVTGANRGLGLAFTKGLLARGARKVYAASRDGAVPEQPGIVPLRLDVTDPAQIAAAVRTAGDVTLLVNNAGIAKPQPLLGADVIAAARDEFETNAIGPLALSRAFAPVLANHGGGAIINMLSVVSWIVLPNAPGYSASKSAAWAFTNGLRSELAAQRTHVLGVHVGFIDTDMVRGLDAPKAKPDDVVAAALAALEANQLEALADDVARQVKQGLSQGVYLGSAFGA